MNKTTLNIFWFTNVAISFVLTVWMMLMICSYQSYSFFVHSLHPMDAVLEFAKWMGVFLLVHVLGAELVEWAVGTDTNMYRCWVNIVNNTILHGVIFCLGLGLAWSPLSSRAIIPYLL